MMRLLLYCTRYIRGAIAVKKNYLGKITEILKFTDALVYSCRSAPARNISYLPTAPDTENNPVKRNGNVAHNNNFNNPKKITSTSTYCQVYKMENRVLFNGFLEIFWS